MSKKLKYIWDTGKGWICEQHPGKEFPHDDCAGPGLPDEEGILENKMIEQKDES